MLDIFSKLFGGSKHEKDVKDLRPIVVDVNEYFEQFQSLSDEELRGKTQEFKQRIREATEEIEKQIAEVREKLKSDEVGSDRQDLYNELDDLEKELWEGTEDVLNEILPEAFAAVKETCRRLLGQEFEVAD